MDAAESRNGPAAFSYRRSPMPARTRKLIGSMAIVGFLGLYIAAVATLAEKIPPHWIAQLVFFVVAGVAWGVPLVPLISWMNRGR